MGGKSIELRMMVKSDEYLDGTLGLVAAASVALLLVVVSGPTARVADWSSTETDAPGPTCDPHAEPCDADDTSDPPARSNPLS